MLFVWIWLIACDTVFLIHGLDLCQMPNRPVCEASGSKYEGDVVNMVENVQDYDSCSVLCLINTQCNALTYNEGAKQCVMFSEANSCKNNMAGWTSSTECYTSRNGELYEWQMIDETEFEKGLNGEIAAEEGSTKFFTCSIPRLNMKIHIESVKWYSRDDQTNEKKLLEGGANNQTLQFNPVTREHAAIYSCEINFFGGMKISSPEINFKVLYIEKVFQLYPEDTSYQASSPYVILKCGAPNSYPKAVTDWFKRDIFTSSVGSARAIDTPIADITGLMFLIVEENLVIFNPDTTTDGDYLCTATNVWMGKTETTKAITLSSSSETLKQTPGRRLTTNSITLGTLQQILGQDIGENDLAQTFTKGSGIWIEEEMAFHCAIVRNSGERIQWSWDNGTLIDGSRKGMSFASGDQTLAFAPNKLRQITGEGNFQISCNHDQEVYVMEFPTSKGDVSGRNLILIDTLKETGSVENNLKHLFGDYFIDKEILIAQIDGPKIADASLKQPFTYIAMNAGITVCQDYRYETMKRDIFFLKKSIQEETVENCPNSGSLVARCHLTDPTKVSWTFSISNDCSLNKINKSALESLDISTDQSDRVAFEMEDGSLRVVSLDTLFSALRKHTSYYSNGGTLTTVIETLIHIKDSTFVSDEKRNLADRLLKFYMGFLKVAEGTISFSDKRSTVLIWTVNFPLAQDAKLAYSSAADHDESANVHDLSINMPKELNSIMDGSKSFLISLYDDPEYFLAIQGQSSNYLSKLVDIDPPQVISNLSTTQEITIGLGISQIIRAYDNPQCYWFDPTDSTWKTDGVTTVGFNSENLFECQTTHLTAFSVLVSPTKLSINHEKILTYLTYVGGTISCIALLLTIIGLSTFREIRRSNTTKIHICLSSTMLLATFLFLVGIDQTEIPMVCTVIGILLHYLWLSVFAWMVVEAYNLYLLFIKVLTSHGSSFIFKLGIPALALPAVIIALTAGLSFESYNHNLYCFLGGRVVYFGFVAPIGVAFAINGGVFAAVIYKIFNKAKYQNFESKAQRILSQMKAISTLACVLGLSWVFGFLTFEHQASIAFHYLFAIFNTLQGLVIFVCHCVIKPDVRGKWLFVICSIGTDTRSGRTSRITTPSKSRMELIPGLFRKRGSTATLSTTVTKLSLTKQLTRQRTDSNGSINIGLVNNAGTLKKKVSLEPVEEKDSTAPQNELKIEKEPLRPMLSTHSTGDVSCTDLTAAIMPLTPPGGEKTFSFDSKSPIKPTSPTRKSLPRKISPTESKVKKALSEYLQNTTSFTEESIVRQNSLVAIDKKKLRRTSIGAANTMSPIYQLPDNGMIHQSLEDRLRIDKSGDKSPPPDSRASSSHSTARSASPFHRKNKKRISPIPPKQDKAASDGRSGRGNTITPDMTFQIRSGPNINHNAKSVGEEISMATPAMYSLNSFVKEGAVLQPINRSMIHKQIFPDEVTSEISSKLADLKEWDWSN